MYRRYHPKVVSLDVENHRRPSDGNFHFIRASQNFANFNQGMPLTALREFQPTQ